MPYSIQLYKIDLISLDCCTKQSVEPTALHLPDSVQVSVYRSGSAKWLLLVIVALQKRRRQGVMAPRGSRTKTSCTGKHENHRQQYTWDVRTPTLHILHSHLRPSILSRKQCRTTTPHNMTFGTPIDLFPTGRALFKPWKKRNLPIARQSSLFSKPFYPASPLWDRKIISRIVCTVSMPEIYFLVWEENPRKLFAIRKS